MNNPRDFYVFLEKEDPFQTAGTVVFSPCFKTFVMIYTDVNCIVKMRYLDLESPTGKSDACIQSGRYGRDGLLAFEVEALGFYSWSLEQKIFTLPKCHEETSSKGVPVHPEFFNRQCYWFSKSSP